MSQILSELEARQALLARLSQSLDELEEYRSLAALVSRSLDDLEDHRSLVARLSQALPALEPHRHLVAQWSQLLQETDSQPALAEQFSRSAGELDAHHKLVERLSLSLNELDDHVELVAQLSNSLRKLEAHAALLERLPQVLGELERARPIVDNDVDPEPVDQIAAAAPAADSPLLEHTANKVLAIEDNVTNMILISRVVESEGYELMQAADGLLALDILAAATPDLILLDINIPGIHGLDLARRLKADPGLAHVPLIATTANVLLGDRERCLDAGCDEYLPKPLDIRELRQVMRNYLKARGG